VLPGLSALFKTSLKLALDTVDYQDAGVGLASARDHVRNEVLVARRIQQVDYLLFRFELGLRNVDGHATVPLLLGLVEDPGVGERGFADLLRLLLVLVHLLVAYLAELVEDVAHEGALARVHVADYDQIDHVFARCVFFVGFEEFLFVDGLDY